MKTKVAVLLHGLGANGIDSLFANLASHWSKDVDITYFLAVDESSTQFWEEKVLSTNVKLVKLHDLDKGRLKIWPKTLYQAMRKYGPFDAVHTNMDMLNGINLLVLWFAGIKRRITHAHNSGNIHKSVKALMYYKINKFMMRLFSTSRIACTDVAGDYFFGKNHYSVILNGIDTSQYRCERDEQQRDFRFCTVGRLHEQKNPLLLVDIFSCIKAIYPSSKLTWVGGGNLKDKITERIAERGLNSSVDMVGTTKDVAKYLKKSDYFLLPSLYEGLAISLIEAQAAGLDCFISDTVPDMSNCGKCLKISLNKTPEQWAQIISGYIEGSQKMKIRPELLRKFDIAEMAHKIELVYNGRSIE